MKTAIKSNNRIWLADTDQPVPLLESGHVDYCEYIARIERVYDDRIDRDLTQIF